MIELNLTLLYQIAGFFILYFILNALLYKPVLKILEERDKNITGTKKEAEALEADIQRRLLDYEKKLNEVKAKGHEERLRLRKQGLDEERGIFENARKTYQDILSNAKAQLEKEIRAALTALKEESRTISKEIAGKILERKVA